MELPGKVKTYRNVLMIYQVNLFFFLIFQVYPTNTQAFQITIPRILYYSLEQFEARCIIHLQYKFVMDY